VTFLHGLTDAGLDARSLAMNLSDVVGKYEVFEGEHA